ncbi:MAG: S8/S53 family peptidase [Actinomycetota bacterium]|nr:S8/S53 family peptidase [Actinomycetota bacterium]
MGASTTAAAASEGTVVAKRQRSYTVIAVVDSGINPYHRDFRRPGLDVHPGSYIEGYPGEASAMNLALRSPSFEVAMKKDASSWSEVRSGRLYWIPGTNIVGFIDFAGEDSARRGYDINGHGTASASIAAGRFSGPGTGDVLLVSVTGLVEGLKWASRQPWIDVITNSWGTLFPPGPVGGEAADASRAAVSSGKIVCFASGNFASPYIYQDSQGPSWNVNVGAASETTRGEHYYTSYPNDVLGLSGRPAASNSSMTKTVTFSGTSAAAPAVCGLIAKTLADVRDRLGDHVEGPHGRGLAVGERTNRGPLRDGVLDRKELEDAIQATAVPAETAMPDPDDPNAVPALPIAGFLRGGYGIVDEASARDALRVILSRDPRPERSLEDWWIESTDEVRDAIWGNPP